jgi:alpha-L-fucosidase
MHHIWTAILLCGGAFAAPPAYQPDWESLKRHRTPEWLLDAKFGIYAHWGVYSVPAFGNEWYARRMYDPEDAKGTYEHHRQTWGPQEKFGYKDFVPMFKAEKFDPDQWAEIIRQSGARYAGIAVVHHDGFALWKSKVNRWNAGEMGPHRDLYGDLVKALRAKNLKIVATEHNMRTFGWYLPAEPYLEQARKAKLDLFDPQYADLYWNEYTSTKAKFVAEWKAKLFEVIDNYRPDVLWFDGGDFQSEDVANAVTATLAHYYNSGPGVEVLNKFAGSKKFNFPREFGMLTFEAGRDRPAEVDRAWIDDLSIGKNSWGYIRDLELQDAGETIRGFVDRVSRGGGLLLSLAPTASGEIPADQQAFLREMGDWLRVNGEAIYSTRPWKRHAEGDTQKLIVKRGQHTGWRFDATTAEDIRFTQKGRYVYAIALGWPADGTLRIKSLTAGAKRVTMLGADAPLKWSQTAAGLAVQMPARRPCKYAYALRIE